MKKLTVWLLLCGMLLAMLAGCVEKAPEQQGSTETDENGSVVVEEESYWMSRTLRMPPTVRIRGPAAVRNAPPAEL